MGPEAIRAHLKREPFQPFRLYVSDGSHYDVRLPEMAVVSRRKVMVGLYAPGDDIPERFAFIAPMRVTRIEPIDGARTRRKPRRC